MPPQSPALRAAATFAAAESRVLVTLADELALIVAALLPQTPKPSTTK